MFAEQKERVTSEGSGVLLCFGNVAEAACGHEGLAVLDGTFPHEHGFRKIARLTVLILEGLVPETSEIGNEGHVACRGEAMRTFRSRSAGEQKAEQCRRDAGNEKFVHHNFLVVEWSGSGRPLFRAKTRAAEEKGGLPSSFHA